MRKRIIALMATMSVLIVALAGVVIAEQVGGGGGNGSSTTAVQTHPAATSSGASQQTSLSTDCQTAADIFDAVRPSVVEITSITSAGGPFGQQAQGTGTGVIVDDQGHILTNNHVIDGAQSIEVRFSDGSTLSAEVSGTDPANDVALIKVDPNGHDLVVAKLGDSDALRVGDPVLAIGNPFNLEGTLTQGIVSALGRTHATGANTRPIRNMIQTDAAVNPGNSGGPLLDCRGEVVGINSLLENPTGQSVNVGVAFAVAINTAKHSLSDLAAGKTIQHPWLGIAGVDVTPALAKELKLSVDKGVYVTLVSQGSPADDANLVPAFRSEAAANDSTTIQPGGDVILTADGKEMTGIDELAGYLDQNKKPGDTVELGVLRDGNQSTITAKLAQWPG